VLLFRATCRSGDRQDFSRDPCRRRRCQRHTAAAVAAHAFFFFTAVVERAQVSLKGLCPVNHSMSLYAPPLSLCAAASRRPPRA
jgi:hypothetical protein